VRTHGRSFETVAIAGSAPRGDDSAEDERLAAGLLASGKYREEHAVVVDMLRASLGPIVETLDVADGPVVLPLRHLQHLETPITGTTRDEAGRTRGRPLHPTPAVGGTPRDVALGLIAEHEAFDRGWYAGPIGWLGADGDGEMMVALLRPWYSDANVLVRERVNHAVIGRLTPILAAILEAGRSDGARWREGRRAVTDVPTLREVWSLVGRVSPMSSCVPGPDRHHWPSGRARTRD
jgi:hypothetical protein